MPPAVTLRVWLGVFVVLPLVLSCDETDPVDAGIDAGMCEAPAPLERGELAGVSDALGAAAGEARAGILEADQLPADTLGMSTMSAGDFVLANDRVAIVIEAEGASDGFDPWGGKPVGLARVEGGALVEPADFGELIFLLGRFIPNVSHVGILRDGSDGGPAVVRAIGVYEPIPAFDVLFRDLLNDQADGLEVAIDYSLAPDASRVAVDLTFRTETERSYRIRRPLLMFMQGNRMPAYAPGTAFDVDARTSAIDWIGYAAEDRTSYALRSPRDVVTPLLELSGVSLFSVAGIGVPGCSLHEESLAEIVIDGPGIHGLLPTVTGIGGLALRTLSGSVTESDGAPAEGVRVIAQTDDGWLDRARTNAAGEYALLVPEGAASTVSAWRASAGQLGPEAVPDGADGPDLSMPPRAWIDVTVSDLADGTPLPARVQVLADDPPEPPAVFGEPRPHGGRRQVVMAADGTARLEVPPGTHSVVASRGYEWDLFRRDVTVAEGETLAVSAPLEQSAPSVGALCGDFHIHTHRSLDALDDARFKVRAAVADGVEILVRTEHEWVTDFEPLIVELGLEPWAYGVGGLELTTFTWGHFGVVGLTPDPALPNGGTFDWAGREAPEVFTDVRARPTASLVVNHPRTFGGLMNEGAYFDSAGYDAVTGAVERPERWDESFTLLEVFNASDFDDNFDATVTDWFSFLAAGRRVFAIGSSDSHQVRETPMGYPRTCVALGFDDAPSLRAAGRGALRDALEAGHSIIDGGIRVEATASGGAGPGDTVSSAADRESVDVLVRAPAWVDVDQLRVFVDGALHETIAIDASTTDPMDAAVRLRASIEVPVASGALGSWIVLVASGDSSLAPVHPGAMPFGVTNPIFFVR